MPFAMFLMQLQNQPDPAMVQHIAMTVLAIMPFLILGGLAVIIVPSWFICKKAGFSPWLSLICAIPLGYLVLQYVLAFSDWKVVPLAPYPMQPPYPPYPPYPPQV